MGKNKKNKTHPAKINDAPKSETKEKSNPSPSVNVGTGTVLGQSSAKTKTSVPQHQPKTQTSNNTNGNHDEAKCERTMSKKNIWEWKEDGCYKNDIVLRYFTNMMNERQELVDFLGNDGVIELMRQVEEQKGCCRISGMPFDFASFFFSPEVIIKNDEIRLISRNVLMLISPFHSPEEWKRHAKLIFHRIHDESDRDDDEDDNRNDDDYSSGSDREYDSDDEEEEEESHHRGGGGNKKNHRRNK